MKQQGGVGGFPGHHYQGWVGRRKEQSQALVLGRWPAEGHAVRGRLSLHQWRCLGCLEQADWVLCGCSFTI